MTPFTVPRRMPMTADSTIATSGLVPLVIMLAIRALERARILPTDKSMPPVRMTKVMPKAMRALMEIWRARFFRLDGSMKLSFNTEMTIKRRIRPIRGPISLMIFFTFAELMLYSPPVASVIMRVWVASLCSTMPATLPS